MFTNKKEVENLSYDNMAEIIQLRNTVGRRDMDAIPGNQQPDGELREYDADNTEKVVIMDPFGENKSRYYVLIAVVVIILAGGIVAIKKYVLK